MLHESWKEKYRTEYEESHGTLEVYYTIKGASDFQQRAIEELNKEAGMEPDEYLGLIKAIELIKTLKSE